MSKIESKISSESIHQNVNYPVTTNLESPEIDSLELMEVRIKQQSELISMMKARNDGMILQITNYEKVTKELEGSKKKLETSLIGLQNDYKTLTERFNILSHNHDELIKIKDEYKYQLKQLRSENHSLSSINDSTETLRIELRQLQEDIAKANAENKALQQTLHHTQEQLREKSCTTKLVTDEIELLKRQISEEETKLTESKRTVQETKKLLSMCEEERDCLRKENIEMKNRLSSVENLLVNKTDSNAQSARKISQLEEELVAIRLQSWNLSKDEKVQLLQNEIKSIKTKLEKTQEEFLAYQEFASKQLKEEKRLNEKLRHFAL